MTGPYAVTDATGHEILVLGTTFTVVIDIGTDETINFAEFADYDLAASLVAELHAQGVTAVIEFEHDTIDLTRAAAVGAGDWWAA